jgi:heme A synthase
MDTTSEISKTQTKTQNGLRTQAIYMVGLLAVQFVLGMVTNLYVQFPDTNRPDELWATARSQLPTFAHIILGILLLVSAIIFVIRTARQNSRAWVISSWAGLISIIVAIYGGVTFTTTQADAYSMVMALGFIASVVAYCWGLFAARG